MGLSDALEKGFASDKHSVAAGRITHLAEDLERDLPAPDAEG